MVRAVIERKEPAQRRDGTCTYELWEISDRGRRLARHASVVVQFRSGNPDPSEARAAKRALRATALTGDLDVVREDA